MTAVGGTRPGQRRQIHHIHTHEVDIMGTASAGTARATYDDSQVDATACRNLWVRVVTQALYDARPLTEGSSVREHIAHAQAVAWVGTPDCRRVLDLAGIDHRAFGTVFGQVRRGVRLPGMPPRGKWAPPDATLLRDALTRVIVALLQETPGGQWRGSWAQLHAVLVARAAASSIRITRGGKACSKASLRERVRDGAGRSYQYAISGRTRGTVVTLTLRVAPDADEI